MKNKVIYDAAKRGDLNAVKYYLEKRVVPTEVKQKIANIGAREDNVNLLEYVVRRDAAINVDRALLCAVEHGALNTTRYLVEIYNANILKCEYSKKKTNYASTAVDIATEKGHLNILKYFLEKRNFSIDEMPISSRRRPLLFRALLHKHANIVEYLIEKKNVDLTALDYEGQNILYTAAYNRDLKFIKYVLDEKKAAIDLNQRNKAGKTLLLKVACWWDCFEILEYLVEQKHVDIVSKAGAECSNGSPLHCVRSAKVCTYLLDRGLNVNERDGDGETPLLRVIDRMEGERTEESVQIFECLIERGANVSLPNRWGVTPLNVACLTDTSYTYRMCKCLVEHGADINSLDKLSANTPLLNVIKGRINHLRKIDLIEYLIEKGAHVNYANNGGDTALHFAAENEDIRVCKYLVEHGADCNKMNRKGETPLHAAALTNSFNICKYLIGRGARVEVKDVYGRSPAQMASSKNLIEYMKNEASKRNVRNETTSEKSFRCPECGAKFVRVQRSAGALPSIFSSSSDIHRHRRLKITSGYSPNVSYAVNDVSNSSSAHLSYFQGFLMLAQLSMTNVSTPSVYSLAAETRPLWSPKVILESRMDPFVENVIGTTPKMMPNYARPYPHRFRSRV